MKVLVVIFLIVLVTSYCMCVDDEKRLLEDFDVHQLQLELQQMRAKMSNVEQKIQQLTSSVSRGAIYTRWGRTDCSSNGTTLVYTGLAAGGDFETYGSAAEYVCLPHNPDFNLAEHSTHSDRAYMYGSEYQDNLFGNNFYDKDVPCAVCISNLANNVLMIPGKSVCINGWKKEYNGRLASQASSFAGYKAAGQYVCVDHNPTVLEGGSDNKNGKLFYPVHAICGSLRCPPYVHNALLNCVVCSK